MTSSSSIKTRRDCRNDLNRKLRGQDGKKSELLEEDRQAMLPIPNDRFEARRVTGGKVNTLSLVRFDRNDYSVPTQYAHREVILVGALDRVRIIADSHVIAEHVRDWDSENVHYDPVHYLALLERKPNSLDLGKRSWSGVCQKSSRFSADDWNRKAAVTAAASSSRSSVFWKSTR